MGLGCSREATSSSGQFSVELANLHAARCTAFTPETTSSHEQLLRKLWRALLGDVPFERTSLRWKELGFQGEDPATDVRGGGLLAMQCIEHFASMHTLGLWQMLHEVRQSSSRYYPVTAVAIVVCARLCDALGLSRGVRGPISSAELDELLAGAKLPLVKFLDESAPIQRKSSSFFSFQSRTRGGFLGIFSLVLADFHARFIRDKYTYMQSQSLLDTVFAGLDKRAGSESTFAALHAAYSADALVAEILDVSRRRTNLQKLRSAATVLVLSERCRTPTTSNVDTTAQIAQAAVAAFATATAQSKTPTERLL